MNQARRVAVVSALRTPIGSFLGSLQTLSAVELGTQVIKALLNGSNIETNLVNEVIMGQVYTAGAGPNPARQAALHAGLPNECVASTVNMVCGSGLHSISLAMQAIQSGRAECIIAGGMESMSNAPFLSQDMRNGKKMGNSSFTDSLIHDALWDPFYDCHMGITAENLADEYQIERDQQDHYAAQSQQRCQQSQASGHFSDEIIPLSIPQRKGDPLIINTDEYPKQNVTSDSIKKLRPAFKQDGTVTAANASGINDGAAGFLLMSEDMVKRLDLKPLAYIIDATCVGVDPRVMGIGPAHAISRLLEKHSIELNQIQSWEINEAFAAQVLAVCKKINLDPDLINPNGGAIALGHPVGASGARISVSLIHEMQRQQNSLNRSVKGIASLCIGGGMGIAALLESA